MSLINSIFRVLRVNKKNWRAVVLCIVAAGVFWFFNAMNKSYTTNASFPVQFAFDEEFYMPVEPLPEHLRMNVTGVGWDLFRRSVGWRVPPIEIELERPASVKKIVGSTVPAMFSSQMETMQVNYVVTDTLYVDIQPRARRWLTLKLDSAHNFLREEYGISGAIEIDPDSIFVEGPINILSEIKEPYPLPLNDTNIDEDFEDEVEVSLPSGHLLTATPAQVFVAFPVEPFVEVTDSVKLRLINMPQQARSKMQVEKLPVTLRMQQSRLSFLAWDSVYAIVDLHDFERGDLRVRPKVEGLPDGVEVVDIDTLRIVY